MEQYNILIVEDDKEIRDGIEIFLKSQNYNVFKAADGVEGLEVMEREKISLAIVDIMMPRMDGVTMTMKLREKYDFPVIMLSAKSEETDKVIGLNIGADDYVTKPFTPLELMARVNSQLRIIRTVLLSQCQKGEVVHKSLEYITGISRFPRLSDVGDFFWSDTALEIAVADFISIRYIGKGDGKIPLAVVGETCFTTFSFRQFYVNSSTL